MTAPTQHEDTSANSGKADGSRVLIVTWNPDKGQSAKRGGYQDAIERTARGETVKEDWSTGVRNHEVFREDRAFLLQQGDHGRGIIASGTVLGEIRQIPTPRTRGRNGSPEGSIGPMRAGMRGLTLRAMGTTPARMIGAAAAALALATLASAPAHADPADDHYLALLASHGITGPPDQLIADAHQTCDALRLAPHGIGLLNPFQMAMAKLNGDLTAQGFNPHDIGQVKLDAVRSYCPEFAPPQ